MLKKVTSTKERYKNFEILSRNIFFDSESKSIFSNFEYLNIFIDNEFIQKHTIFFAEKVKIQNLIQLTKRPELNSFNRCKSEIFFRNKLNIAIKANNIFCSFSEVSNSKNKNIQSASTGMYKIKTTKKRIKYTYIKMISTFIRKIYHRLENFNSEEIEDFDPFAFTMLNIVSQKKLHKSIIKIFETYGGIKRNFNQPFFFINIEPKKCFNGCRVSKKRRKKRLKNVVFG